MKDILKMYVYIPLTILMFFYVVYSMVTQSGGKTPITAQNLNVKNIRSNPTSFRAHYMPRILSGGGK
ncbi:MAG: hypothetical protein JNJ69_18485 [Leptospiraceae bacterium]|nr:hypothetical protein [Leptospiraceae bacterium]